jgi:hypothetical protein
LTVALRSAREPHDVARDRRDYYRYLETERSTEFGATFTDQQRNEVHSFAHWAPTAIEAQEQLELGLPGYSKNHHIRQRLSSVLVERALPEAQSQGRGSRYVENCAKRLKHARWSGAVGYSLGKSKSIVFWDEKAGLSRLCPDDAREEAQRLSRKVLGPLEALQSAGHALHYCVFTTPNAAPGRLRKEMVDICKRFRRVILKSKWPDGSPRFPEIKGALCVLEAPLGGARDWNVHLNVILVVDGYLDYKKLRSYWHWDVHARPLAVGPGVVKGALTELIKYAVAATVAKSAEKALESDGGGGGEEKRVPPPPMLEWSGRELLEWMLAMRGFRRTRTYGRLFRLPKPEAEDLGQIVWLGRVDHNGQGYSLSSRLLNSIPEDKSTGLTPMERWLALLQSLKPATLVGAGELGSSIPRDLVHRTLAEL